MGGDREGEQRHAKTYRSQDALNAPFLERHLQNLPEKSVGAGARTLLARPRPLPG